MTFLGWRVHVTLSKVVGDLQLGDKVTFNWEIKRSHWITWQGFCTDYFGAKNIYISCRCIVLLNSYVRLSKGLVISKFVGVFLGEICNQWGNQEGKNGTIEFSVTSTRIPHGNLRIFFLLWMEPKSNGKSTFSVGNVYMYIGSTPQSGFQSPPGLLHFLV